ncbi:MAG TPA: isoprenylcysteine carboxylmethyltransferase family protein [Burkholderiaceae bacterium]|nr:isoprenylcysteine carboxylmethyltransferase family protein [Burkholderiaceae bacterium]
MARLAKLLDNRIPPPVVGAAVAAAMWWASSRGLRFDLPAYLRHGLTAVLAIAGVAFDLSGLLSFRSSRTTVNPLSPDRASSLVTTGVYRFTRNPMYVGMLLLLLAWAVHLSSGWAFVGPMAFVLYITRFQIRPEESALRRRFGERFDTYAARVRRWL